MKRALKRTKVLKPTRAKAFRWIIRLGALATAAGAIITLKNELFDLPVQCHEDIFQRCLVAFIERPVPAITDPVRNRIGQFVTWEYLENREKYDDQVDLFSNGIVSRQVAEKEQENFDRNFPIRNYTMLPGTIIITSASKDQYVVTFGFEFSRAKTADAKPETGNGRIQLRLKDRNGEFFVTSAKNIVHNWPVQPQASPLH
jgi:hypothetical protein